MMDSFGVKALLALVGVVLSELLGGWDTAIYVLLVLIATDYVSGVLSGVKNRQLNSSIGFHGLIKKVMIILLVVLANCMDMSLGLAEPYLRTGVIYFYSINEGISIIENAVKMGIPIPSILTDLFANRKEGY